MIAATNLDKRRGIFSSEFLSSAVWADWRGMFDLLEEALDEMRSAIEHENSQSRPFPLRWPFFGGIYEWIDPLIECVDPRIGARKPCAE